MSLELKENLIEIVDKTEITKFISILIIFLNNTNKHDTECGIITDLKLNIISECIISKSEKWIDIPLNENGNSTNSYFGIVGHSHVNSNIPLPSWKDIEIGILKSNVKYNIISTKNNGFVIIRNNNIFNKPSKEKLKEAYENAFNNRKKYLNRNELKIKNKYKDKIDQNKVSSIEYKYKLKNIENQVKNSTIKEQCQFFDDQLRKYGIRLIFINFKFK